MKRGKDEEGGESDSEDEDSGKVTKVDQRFDYNDVGEVERGTKNRRDDEDEGSNEKNKDEKGNGGGGDVSDENKQGESEEQGGDESGKKGDGDGDGNEKDSNDKGGLGDAAKAIGELLDIIRGAGAMEEKEAAVQKLADKTGVKLDENDGKEKDENEEKKESEEKRGATPSQGTKEIFCIFIF